MSLIPDPYKENYHFEDNDENLLKEISLNKKIFYYGICISIIIAIGFVLNAGQLIIPGKRKLNDLYFRGVSLYLICFSGILWIVHFVTQIIGSNYKDKNLNNLYFKRAYNYRILAIIFLIISYLIAFFYSYSKDNIDSKFKKEYIIYW